MADLRILGFIDAIEPKQKMLMLFVFWEALLLQWRIEYANFLMKNNLTTKMIILLAGERYVTENRDGSKVELKKMAQKFNIADWTKLT